MENIKWIVCLQAGTLAFSTTQAEPTPSGDSFTPNYHLLDMLSPIVE